LNNILARTPAAVERNRGIPGNQLDNGIPPCRLVLETHRVNTGLAFVETRTSDRLRAQLGADGPRLILICAPAGFGKTALLRYLHREAREQGLSSVFLEREQLRPRHRRDAVFAGHAKPASEPRIIFIDNAQDDPDSISPQRLRTYAESTSGSQFILASRTVPTFNWLPLQLAGQCEVLRAADLQLGLEEVRCVLARYSGRQVNSSTVHRISSLSEGWPLAVQLCAMEARKQADWSDVIRVVLEQQVDLAAHFDDLVAAEVHESLHRFLMTVFPLDRFSAALCRDVLGLHDAEIVFAEAIRLNLYVVPTEEAGWYRLHTAFRTYLTHRTTSNDTEHSRRVLEAARDWCLREDLGADAIEYSLRLGDFHNAEQMLLTLAPRYVAELGRFSDVIRWIDTIECKTGRAPPALKLWKIGALIFSMRLAEAKREQADFEESTGLGAATEVPADLAMRLEHLRCVFEIKSDAMTQGEQRALNWQVSYPSAPPFYRAAVALMLSASSLARGRDLDYMRYLGNAKRATLDAKSAYVDAWVSSLEILGEANCGYLECARRLAENALGSARRSMGDKSPVVATLSLLMARILCEGGDLYDAEPHLERGLALLGEHGLMETAIAGLEAVVTIVEARSGPAAALAEARHQSRRCVRFAARFDVESARIVVSLLLRMDDVASARQEFNLKIAQVTHDGPANAIDPAVRKEVHERCLITEGALLIAEGQHARALRILSPLLPIAEARGQTKRLVQLRILHAAALQLAGNEIESRKGFTRALIVASECSYLQTLCDFAWLVRPFICATTVKMAPTFAARLRKRLGLDTSAPAHDTGRMFASTVEPLTEREIGILELLDSGLRNQAVAHKLHLSLATVKWHLQNLYAKLSVSNRSGALATARRFGLL
jgi:LuxR family maltose regulon positive regulatory protein